MSPKILRRCTICKKFHASYLVEDSQLGKCYLCYTCWKARQDSTPDSQEQQTNALEKSADQPLSPGLLHHLRWGYTCPGGRCQGIPPLSAWKRFALAQLHDYQTIEPSNYLTKQSPQPFSTRLLKHLHHFLRFAELLDQAVHVLHFHAGAGGDAPAA